MLVLSFVLAHLAVTWHLLPLLPLAMIPLAVRVRCCYGSRAALCRLSPNSRIDHV